MLKALEEKIKVFKEKVSKKMAEYHKIIDEANRTFDMDLSEPYTQATAPEWVKKLPVEARDGWIKAYNSAFKQYKGDEGKAFGTAGKALENMGYKKKDDKWVKVKEAVRYNNINSNSSPKEIFKELISDINLFLSKAEGNIKGKLGSPAVRSFLREVKMKLKGMVKNIKETDLIEAAETVVNRIEKIEDAAYAGSLEDLRDKLRTALGAADIFPFVAGLEEYARKPWIRYTFPKKVIAEYNNKNYEVTYEIKNKQFIFGKPKEVEETYILKEVEAHKGQKHIDITERGSSETKDLSSFVSLKEADFNKETGEVLVILIEAGTNFKKKRHYSVETVEAAAPMFVGMKMYINHQTQAEEKARPERDLKDWASTITESYAENGKAIGKVAVHDKWLRERLADPVARVHIGLSINTGGQVSYGKIDGQEVQIVEKILPHRKNGPASVDWVTEAGARGRVKGLLESRREDIDMLENVTLEDLKKERPDLVKSIEKDIQESGHEKKKEQELKEAKEKTAELEKKDKIRTQQGKVEELLKESKLPEPAKARIKRRFETTLHENEAELKEAVGVEVKAEAEYINKLSDKGKIKLGEGGQDKNLKESLGKELDNRFNIKEEKKED